MSIEQSLLALSGIFLLACCSPGPVFLLIASTSAHHGRAEGIRVALGVAGATLVWTSLTVMGLGLVLASVVWAQTLIRIVAGLYLLWLGISMIRSSLFIRPGPTRYISSRKSAPMRGFVASVTNPKALAFFGSAFALTAPAQPTLLYHMAAVICLTVLSATWHCLLAVLFATPILQRGYQGMKRQIDLLVGAVLVVLGSGMLTLGTRTR
ncbi:LysE family transporter [Haematobacter genomosp. 1]|uniref:Lysine transporter LysE n=1 Tax=Haematobacter genomosp. 1 TaxID=366618 RepID=A0A212AAR6_9RHOB|nr:LysE family transporter [Haematobacter genomosp. 1]OWJ77428.1 hypothetical protein CDV49_11395 [Haematobacter genomosp. 1]